MKLDFFLYRVIIILHFHFESGKYVTQMKLKYVDGNWSSALQSTESP